MWRLLKSRVFRKYILSYLVVFFIPFAIMSVFIYHHSVTNLKTEIEHSNINKLKQVRKETENRMQEMQNIAIRIAYDPHLTRYMVNNPITQMEAINQLALYKASSSIVDQLFLYFRNSDEIYSDQGLYSLDTLLNKAYIIKSRPKDAFINTLQTIDQPTILPADIVVKNNQKTSSIISFLYPIPQGWAYKNGVVMFYVKESVFRHLIEHTLGDFKGDVGIFDSKNRLIATASNGGDLTVDDLRPTETTPLGIHTAKIRGNNYSLVSVQSDVSGWTFVTAMPTAQFFGSVSQIQLVLAVFFGSVVLGGVLLALIFAVQQFKPIRTLIDFTQNRSGTTKQRAGTSGEHSVQHIVTSLMEDHDSLQERVSAQEPFVRDQCLLRLLKGDWHDIAHLQQLLVTIGVTFPYRNNFVTFVTFDDKASNAKSKGAVLSALKSSTLARAVTYEVELIHDNAIAVIVNTNGETIADIDAINQQLREQVQLATDVHVALGVGNVYRGLQHIHQSFIEASGAVAYWMASDRISVIYFHELATRPEVLDWTASDAQIKLVQALKQGNEKVALAATKDVFHRLSEQHLPIHLLKCYSFDLINAVLRTARELQYGDNRTIKDLVDFTSVGDLEQKITAVIRQLCAIANKNKELDHKRLHNEMIRYMNAHFTSDQFSLERMADHFNLSTSYLSRFIKEVTGETFTKHLWRLRSEKVKVLLVTTDQPIKTIVQAVGYVDVPNFTRKFKKEEGITPGQYRKAHHRDLQQNESEEKLSLDMP
ncbi:helix-turn-helix domain-containing protein [Numidum massiliense]|uniref:helix-turn-helix domain-containing protein n=1 Tax=Numidum massiliense TaxID=1522315 RepID=UPI0006D54ACF|nr:helix-turn-helix domain-containing protein [Numidum massiliense]